MPTPFTHLVFAQRLIDDPLLSSAQRDFLHKHWGDFLLGNISPDAHHKTQSLRRVDTHFFEYGEKVSPLAEDVLLDTYPNLGLAELGLGSNAAFIAGYLAHLAVDEIWYEEVILRFALEPDWGSQKDRHFLFVSLMCVVDKRDFERLPSTQYADLAASQMNDYLPFMEDSAICAWRDMVVNQIQPGGERETLEIMGRVVEAGQEQLTQFVNSPERLETQLWSRFSLTQLHAAEELAYQHMRQVVCNYLKLVE